MQIEGALRLATICEDLDSQAASAAAPEAPHSKGKTKRVPQTTDIMAAMEKQRNHLGGFIADWDGWTSW